MNPHIDAVVQVPLLSAEQCTQIRQQAAGRDWRPACIDDGSEDARARSCSVLSLSDCAGEVLGEALAALLACVRHFNARCWQFALDGSLELNLLRYGVGDHYQRWHTDVSAEASTRKLSFTVQLSESYTGGALCMEYGAVPTSRRLGEIILFPSFLPHRVEPVLTGERMALVGWMHGPPFR